MRILLITMIIFGVVAQLSSFKEQAARPSGQRMSLGDYANVRCTEFSYRVAVLVRRYNDGMPLDYDDCVRARALKIEVCRLVRELRGRALYNRRYLCCMIRILDWLMGRDGEQQPIIGR